MTAYEYHDRAAELRAEANRIMDRTAANAKRAARSYAKAAEYRQVAAWIDGHPGMELSAAEWERCARTATRLADTFLRSVFSAAEHARLLRASARTYESMASAAEARYARLMATPQF